MNHIIQLAKKIECYECEGRKKIGTRFNCERCNKTHFVCKDCIPIYLEYEENDNFNVLEEIDDSIQNKIVSNSKMQYSEATIKESQ